MLVMISACGVLAEPGRQLLVQVLELAVEVEQLTGKPGDQRCGDRFPGQYDGLFTGDGDRGCGHGEDAGRPRLLGAQELRHRIDTGGAKPGGSLKPGEQDQRRAGGVVERFFQAGEDDRQRLIRLAKAHSRDHPRCRCAVPGCVSANAPGVARRVGVVRGARARPAGEACGADHGGIAYDCRCRPQTPAAPVSRWHPR
jgi:hypothetical protein